MKLERRRGLLAFVCLVFPGLAVAAPGDHIRTGNAEIVPSVQLTTEWRSNVYLEEGIAGGGDSEVNPGFALKLEPKIEIEVKGADAIAELDAGYRAKKYVTPGLSNLDRFTDFNLGGRLDLLPESMVGVRLSEDLSYTGYESEATYADHAYTSHLANNSLGLIAVHPGGALEVDAGASLDFDEFGVPQGASLGSEGTGQTVSLNQRLGYGPQLNSRWKFLPKTAVVLDFYYKWYSWQKNLLNALGDEGIEGDAGEIIAIPDFREWKAYTGIRGRFTQRLVVDFLVGYGQMNYLEETVDEANQDLADPIDLASDVAEGDIGADLKGFPEGFLTTVALAYSPEDNHKFNIGYMKDFRDSYFTNFMAYHYTFLRYHGLYAQKVSVIPEISYRFEDFNGEVERSDHFIRAKLDGGYNTTDFLVVGAGVWWTQRATADGEHEEIQYDDFNVHANATFIY